MAEKNQGKPTIQMTERQSDCPFETSSTTCKNCGGLANVYPAGIGLTEVHCDDCGTHYNQRSGFFKKH